MKISRTAAAVLILLGSHARLSYGESRRLRAPWEDFSTASDQKKLPRRQLAVQASVEGNNGTPASAFPLQKCQGDCDNDGECADSLICFQRSSDEAIPGCTGFKENTLGLDFCYDPADVPISPPGTLARVGNDGSPSSAFPLSKCEGDCDRDSDCEGTLKCFQRGAVSSIPGCNGVAATDGTDYCYDPADVPTSPPIPAPVPAPVAPPGTLARVGNDGSPSSSFPLSKCEGDCDRDSDCEGSLICFQRGRETTIPGCNGVAANDGTDYCYDPADLPPSPQAAPTSGTLSEPGKDWEPSDAFPLGLCEGDCDGDFDCAGELVCHQREGGGPVPSCAGRGDSSTDYCIHPGDETARPPVAGAFRMKMYWEFGYDWQEEFWEQEWCIECLGSKCKANDEIFLGSCMDDNAWFVFENLINGETQLQIAKTDLCLEWVDARDVRVRTCNKLEIRQKFRAGNGSFGGEKFELTTVAREGCLSQHHHPRAEERIFRMDCEQARKFDTSYWFQY